MLSVVIGLLLVVVLLRHHIHRLGNMIWSSRMRYYSNNVSTTNDNEVLSLPTPSMARGIIVELRRHPALELVIDNVQTKLNIPITLVHGWHNRQFANDIYNSRSFVDTLVEVNADNLDQTSYSTLLTDEGFWKSLNLGRADQRVLIFQTDSGICGYGKDLDKFLNYDLCGANWYADWYSVENKQMVNGGLSLRNPQAMLRLIQNNKDDTNREGYEDYLFTNWCRKDDECSVCPEQVANIFSTEKYQTKTSKPWGFHKNWGNWGNWGWNNHDDVMLCEFNQKIRDIYINLPKNKVRTPDNNQWSPVCKISKQDVVFVLLCHRTIATESCIQLSVDRLKLHYVDPIIVVIDDNSPLEIPKDLGVSEVIVSEYPGAGEFLPYFYFWKRKWATRMVMLHDSSFIHSPIPIDFSLQYQTMWTAPCYWEDDVLCKNLLSPLENSKTLVKFYMNKNMWQMSRGAMAVVSWDLVNTLQTKTKVFTALSPLIKTVKDRMGWEMILGLLCAWVGENNPAIFVNFEPKKWEDYLEQTLPNSHQTPTLNVIEKVHFGR